eukprot:TRINITY_DN16176_c0_g1_i1.p1 TRINITY_DN16176_c0_g1~~TRINITY_DN16176_c0_g1_i1.p1  ORF type:complete len:315 (-),score=78.59 TRINITY_DN16176_c0_g1_i1:58-1002(-)
MTTTLFTGKEMPLVGLGTWKIEKDVCADVVYTAIKVGYRLIDCASDYGNEKEVGQGINKAISEGIVKREDLFVTSKLWCTYHAKQHVKPAFERSLSDLGLEYLDLYLIHFPISLRYVDFEDRYPAGWDFDPSKPGCQLEDSPVHETWSAMEELVKDGKAKHIGLSNFNAQSIMDIQRYAVVKPAVLQIEFHPLLQQPTLVGFCHKQGIALTGYSTFGGQSYKVFFPAAESLLDSEVIQGIAQKHGKTPSQVLLKFAVQTKVAVIPKSSSEERLKQNLDLFSFELDEEDLKVILALDKNARFNDPAMYAGLPIFA